MQPRQLCFNTFDEAIAEIKRLAAGGYQKAGKWSLGQMCEHLAIDAERVMEGKTFRVPVLVGLVAPLFKKPFFRARRMRSGFRAPAVLLPQDGADETREIARAIEAWRKFSAFSGPFPRNPIFGVLTPHEWRDLQLIHAAHHLGHLIPNQAVAA